MYTQLRFDVKSGVMNVILLQAFDTLIGSLAKNTYEEVFNRLSPLSFDLLLPSIKSPRLIQARFGVVDTLADYNVGLLSAREETFPKHAGFLFNTVGIVSVFYNISGYQMSLTREENKVFRLGDRQAAAKNAISLGEKYACPVFMAIINHNIPPIENLQEEDWWAPSGDWIGRVQSVGNRIKFQNYTINQMYTLVTDAINHILEYAYLAPTPYTGYVEHPYLSGAKVRPWHLGLGSDTTHNFVVDCIRSLVPDTLVRIHVDAVATWPVVDDMSGDFGHKIDEMTLSYDSKVIMEAEAEPAWGDWKNAHMLNVLFVPGTEPQAPAWDIIAPYHVSIEVKGIVYDSMYAFKGVPIDEYRSKLNSTWHRVLDVPVGADPRNVVADLGNLVKHARNARSVPR